MAPGAAGGAAAAIEPACSSDDDFACSQSTVSSGGSCLLDSFGWETLLPELSAASSRPTPTPQRKELSIAGFFAAAAETRARLPPHVELQAVPLMLCDGQGWEAGEAGVDIVAGCFVRVAAGSDSISRAWHFVGKVEERHDAGSWEVDLGADYGHCFVVKARLLHRIQVDLNTPGAVEEHLQQRARQGLPTSRRLGADRQPIAD